MYNHKWRELLQGKGDVQGSTAGCIILCDDIHTVLDGESDWSSLDPLVQLEMAEGRWAHTAPGLGWSMKSGE